MGNYPASKFALFEFALNQLIINYMKMNNLKISVSSKYLFTSLMLVVIGTSSCKKNPIPEKLQVGDQNEKNIAKTSAVTYYLAANSNSAQFQALVNQAVAGDIIILRTGSHYITSSVRLPVGKNSITIRGEAGAVIRKAPYTVYQAAIEIKGNSNVIDLIELDGGNLPEAGILIYGQRNVVSNSKIHNCGSAAAKGAAVHLHNLGTPVCALNVVIGCKIYYNYMVGISQNGHSDGTIRDNHIYENGAEGLTVDIKSHNNYIYNNWIYKNNVYDRGVGGVGIDFSNGNRLDRNTIEHTYYRSGITFQNNIGGCDGTIVSNNQLNYNAKYGILQRFTQYANTNTSITNNTYVGNTLGTTYIQY